ncbi:hypothetical protein NN561_007974 [Cricetulus griseus]
MPLVRCVVISSKSRGHLSLQCEEVGPAFPVTVKGGAGSAWPSDFITHGCYTPNPCEVTQATDINTETSCTWTMDPDTALGSSSTQDNILYPGGSPGRSDWDESRSSMAPRTPTKPQLVASTPGFCVSFGGNMGLGRQHRPPA